MRLRILAVGRLRAGPERDLIADYIKRADRTGRALGLGPVEIVEVEDKRGGGKRAEAGLLLKAVSKGAQIWALDERGRSFTSPEFAKALGDTRDHGIPEVCLCIGGADGLDESLLAEASRKISFGKMVWPHMLVRVMLSEQIYRATSILAGAPYHRE